MGHESRSFPIQNHIKMVEAYTLIDVDNSKLKHMESFCWCPLEKPIIAVPIEFNKKDKKGKKSGYFMLTYGSIYLFKNKILPKEMKKPILYHLLDAKVLHVMKKKLIIDFDKFHLKIKTESFVKIAEAMLYILRSMTFGLNIMNTMKLDKSAYPSFKDVKIKQRPNNALQWRALFLAHFYNIQGEQLYTMDYFQKYEVKKTPMILIGPSLHPGNFGAAFGHAIAWEPLIKMVCFQAFGPTKFDMFFDSLVDNARTIKRMAFTEYHKPSRIPTFTSNKIGYSSIIEYNFYRILLSVVMNFLQKTKSLPQVELLVIHKIQEMNADEFNQFCEVAEMSPTLQNTLRHFEFCRTTIQKFPVSRFTPMLNSFLRLESISLRYLNGDLWKFMRAIFASTAPIRVVHLNYMKNNKVLSHLTLPKTLIHLDLSFNHFSDDAFLSALKLITKDPMENPIIFQAQNVVIEGQFYEKLSQIDHAQCHQNICEFHFNGNEIPAEKSLALFSYLFIQKKLRLVSFSRVKCEAPIDFLKNLMTLITNLELPGFDVSGNFDSVTISQFMSALSTMNLPYLRHIGFPFSKCGSQGLGALNSLVLSLPNLVELMADGSEAEPPAIEAFWTTVGQSNIMATDLPINDMKRAHITIENISKQNIKAIERLKAKTRISTCGKRDEVILRHIRAGEPFDTSAKIFAEAAEFTDYEPNSNDHDFAVNESETAKLDNIDKE